MKKNIPHMKKKISIWNNLFGVFCLFLLIELNTNYLFLFLISP